MVHGTVFFNKKKKKGMTLNFAVHETFSQLLICTLYRGDTIDISCANPGCRDRVK